MAAWIGGTGSGNGMLGSLESDFNSIVQSVSQGFDTLTGTPSTPQPSNLMPLLLIGGIVLIVVLVLK